MYFDLDQGKLEVGAKPRTEGLRVAYLGVSERGAMCYIGPEFPCKKG
jgi:hypothetical protein